MKIVHFKEGRVKLSLRTATGIHMRSGGTFPLFLISALDGSKWTASCFSRFISGETASGIRYTSVWGWVGRRAVWTLWRKHIRSSSSPKGDQDTTPPSSFSWPTPTELYRLI
jgi:hypothetical protein